MIMSKKTYSELIKFNTYDDRLDYLRTNSKVGYETLRNYRYLSQQFYKSYEWLHFKRDIIIRDNSCDLGLDGYDILGKYITIHHINPISIDDLINHSYNLLDPNNVITVSFDTHNAIHFMNKDNYELNRMYLQERHENDTCPWKK